MPWEQRFPSKAGQEWFPCPRSGSHSAAFLNQARRVLAIWLLSELQGWGTGETSALQKPQQLWRVKVLTPQLKITLRSHFFSFNCTDRGMNPGSRLGLSCLSHPICGTECQASGSLFISFPGASLLPHGWKRARRSCRYSKSEDEWRSMPVNPGPERWRGWLQSTGAGWTRGSREHCWVSSCTGNVLQSALGFVGPSFNSCDLRVIMMLCMLRMCPL